MQPWQIVLDTNVLIAALRSRNGASFKLLTLVGNSPLFQINLSVPLVLEYEDVALRPDMTPGLTAQDVADVLDYLCLAGRHHQIFYLWRPFLKDAKDDMVLELAVESGSDFIVSFNGKDFAGIETFGLSVVSPLDFLRKIGAL